MKNIAVLGSTGSIGTQTLEVAAANPERIRVVALAAHKMTNCWKPRSGNSIRPWRPCPTRRRPAG